MTPSPGESLPPFPRGTGGGLELPAPLAGRGLRLRAANEADLSWLRTLYAGTRAEEMAGVPWPEAARRAFLDQQFALQHRHYVLHFADADFLVLESGDGPCGRLYLRRTAPEHLLVDISLFAHCRGAGLGTALVQAAQDDAARAGRDLCLHVQAGNDGAMRLYRRLGFLPEGETGTGHRSLRWRQTLS